MLPLFDGVIFDLDGTLTEPQHDFDRIRAMLGIPPGELILEYLDALPPADAAKRRRRLDRIEAELASESRPASGALNTLMHLQQRQVPVAILTRNSRSNALLSLRAIQARQYFKDELIIGRDEAPAKPDPAGIHLLSRRMGIEATRCLLIGDYRHDLEAGRRAGCFTIHLAHPSGTRWPEYTDLGIDSLQELLGLIS